MSDTTESTQTYASGRYSKRKRTQVTYHLDDLEYSDDESDFESPQAKKPKAKANSKPPPPPKAFRFLDLPAEIRNTIYSYTLCDPDGINIVGAFKHRRRTVMRMPADLVDTPNGVQRKIFRFLNQVSENRRQNLPLILPSLLAVNKQIYSEAISILYGNEFVFLDSSALYNFLINLGPSGVRHLKSIRLMGWHWSRGKTAYNHTCFGVLAWATNLTSFHIEAPTGHYRSRKLGADQFYRDAFSWLEAFGSANGKRDAAVDILHMTESCFPNHWGLHGSTTHAEREEKFKTALRDCLNKRYDMIMATPVNKVKKSKK